MTFISAAALSERDSLVLQFLFQHGVASPREFLPLFPSLQALYKRMHFLRKRGWIESLECEVLPNGGRPVLYTLARQFRRRNTYLDRLTHRSFWNHQICVGKVANHLTERLPNAMIIAEGQLGRASTRIADQADHLPDLFVLWKNLKIAVEIERSVKRDFSRYRRKWSGLEDSDCTHVLYYCERQNDLETLLMLSRGFQKIAFALLAQPDVLICSGARPLSLTAFLERTFQQRRRLEEL